MEGRWFPSCVFANCWFKPRQENRFDSTVFPACGYLETFWTVSSDCALNAKNIVHEKVLVAVLLEAVSVGEVDFIDVIAVLLVDAPHLARLCIKIVEEVRQHHAGRLCIVQDVAVHFGDCCDVWKCFQEVGDYFGVRIKKRFLFCEFVGIHEESRMRHVCCY